jgi:endogenous inhibitor of DNA gyrase (YacG/DUF329 family)
MGAFLRRCRCENAEERPKVHRRADAPGRARRGNDFALSGLRQRAYFWAMADTSSAKPCPICRKPAAERFRPFCSGRCKDVDLNRWFKGAYAIPAAESADDSDDQAQPPRGE